MTTAEAAARLNALTGRRYTNRNVSRICKSGGMAAVRHGRDWWIEPDEVERYAREGSRNGRGGRPAAREEGQG